MRIHASSVLLGAIVGVAVAGLGILFIPGVRTTGIPVGWSGGREAVEAPARDARTHALHGNQGGATPPGSDSRQARRDAEKDDLAPADLDRMLHSSSRLDQIRAIEILLDAETPEAAQMLIDALLGSTDPVLLALLEEALLKSPLDLSPAVQAVFAGSKDPRQLSSLAHLLTQLVAKRPDLQRKVVGFFLGALDDADTPERADSASKALVALGVGAADQVSKFLTDPKTTPEGAGTAAWVLSQLPGEHGDVLRKELRDGFDATLKSLSDPDLPDPDKKAVRQKSGSLAWAALQRPEAEHERIADVLVDSLARTTDEAQAGTLVWGLVNLKGLTDEGSLRVTQTLLDSLVGQPNAQLAHAYVRAVGELAAARGTSSAEFQRLVEQAWSAHGSDPRVAPHLTWLRAQIPPR